MLEFKLAGLKRSLHHTTDFCDRFLYRGSFLLYLTYFARRLVLRLPGSLIDLLRGLLVLLVAGVLA
ncbi:MAG: hypothetical protein WBB28_19945 [Crinalium sp.]